MIVIAATNYPESLDKALVRPGRFDRHVTVPPPDVRGRRQILDVLTKGVPLSADVSLETLARGTPGFTGAELANLVNQAAVKASLEGKVNVGSTCVFPPSKRRWSPTDPYHRHLEYSKDRILMGAERKSAVIEEANRKIVAFHEGGHALVAMLTPAALPVHKATIMPRGAALGMVAQLPEKDELSWTRAQLIARMDVAMAGRVAEELVFGADNITSGAASDLEAATRVAQAMVTKFGMSARVGPVAIKDDSLAGMSSETRAAVETEVRKLLEDARARAEALLRKNRHLLDRLAAALLDYESLTKDEIDLVLADKPLARERIPRPDEAPTPADAAAAQAQVAPKTAKGARTAPAPAIDLA